MDIKEKAQEYAKDKIQQVLNDAIAEAYMEGYKQGYEDGKAEVPVKHENDEMEFVDLGLPSGTLWAKDYLKENGEVVYLPYIEAKNYKLPTKEQLEELIKWCNVRSEGDPYLTRTRIIGTSGAMIQIPNIGYYEGEKKEFKTHNRIWLQDNESNSTSRSVGYFSTQGISTFSTFMGFKLPVLLVK